MEDYKRVISFKDKVNKLAKIEIEIKKGRLSMCGEYGSGSGQCLDDIKPSSPEQKSLIALWTQWHLNDMNAGTPEQTLALEGFDGDYTAQCEFLKEKGLYEVKLPTGKMYKYGSGWLTRGLPIDIIATVSELVAKIESQEEAKKLSLEGGDWTDLDDDRIIALGKSLQITPNEAKEDITDLNDEVYDYCGTEYFVLTDSEAEEKCRDYLEEYQWKCAVESDSTTLGYNEWVKWVIDTDGYGHLLNSWDGSEDYESGYYVIRCG